LNAEVLKPIARKLLRTHRVQGARSADLAQALATGKPRRVADGERLCSEGDPSDSMFILLKGRIQVLRKDDRGEERQLAMLTAPALVGHMGLVDGSARSASCVAMGEIGCLRLTRVAFQRLLEESSASGGAMRRLILASLIGQLTSANTRIKEMITAPEPQPDAPESLRRDISSDDILKLAGVLDGWSVDRTAMDTEVRFVEDDDMRRTREARVRKR
jgi:CRP/FNR family cyclic AMP-dependent transcriptional regulator